MSASLPEGWAWSTVEQVGQVQLGRQRSPKYHDGQNMKPYLRVANVFEDRIDASDLKYMHFEPEEYKRYRLYPGDVLLNEGQTPALLGRPAIYRGQPEDIAFTNSLIRFQAGESVDPRWALLVFRHHLHSGRFTRESRITTNIAHLSAARFKKVEFPVPPLDEQRRIVEILEDHLSRIDSADSELTRVGRRLESLRVSWLNTQYSHMVEPGTAAATIGDLCATRLGKMLDAKKNVGADTKYLRNANVRWGSFDLNDVSAAAMTDEDRRRLALAPGDILVCEGGEPGRCAVWSGSESPMTFQKALHRLRVRESTVTSPDFVALMLEQAVRGGRTTNMVTGTTIKHLPQEKLRRLVIPAPVISEQVLILQSATQLTEQSAFLAEARQTAGIRLKALRKALLSAAFCGRLTRNTSFDEIEEMAGV